LAIAALRYSGPTPSQERVHELQFLYAHRIDRNKRPLKISGKVAVGVVGDSCNFFRATKYTEWSKKSDTPVLILR